VGPLFLGIYFYHKGIGSRENILDSFSVIKNPLIVIPITNQSLKVVANEKQGGSGRWQMIGIGLGLCGGDRCSFVFLFGRHLGLILFPFPLTPAE
jgi:hypothetical protein